MFRIKIIVVDRTRAPFLVEGEALFLDRLTNYARVEWVEVKPSKIKKGRPEREIMELEKEAIIKKVMPKDYLVALDRCGQTYDSEGLARWLERLPMETGGGAVCFAIGGPLGLSEEILERAHKVWSLSRLTLTHEMSRLLLLEQLYRAFTIIRGEKYHK